MRRDLNRITEGRVPPTTARCRFSWVRRGCADVGPGSGGLADVPRRPDAPRDLSRDALHVAPPDRRGGRGAGRPRDPARGSQVPGSGRGPPAGGAPCGARGALDRDGGAARHTRSILVTGAERIEDIAVHLGMLGADFRVTEPPQLVEALRVLAARYVEAADPEWRESLGEPLGKPQRAGWYPAAANRLAAIWRSVGLNSVEYSARRTSASIVKSSRSSSRRR